MKDLQARFAEVERRVRLLVDENGRLRETVTRLERELTAARAADQELTRYRERQDQIRERLARVLKTLEALETEEQENASDGTTGAAESP